MTGTTLRGTVEALRCALAQSSRSDGAIAASPGGAKGLGAILRLRREMAASGALRAAKRYPLGRLRPTPGGGS
jgi:hypothetical protein